jgi:hypothetical protein
LTAEQRSFYDGIVGGRRGRGAQSFGLTDDDGVLTGPFGIMLLAPRVGGALSALGEAVRFDTGLSPRMRELAILVVAARHRSAFEWYAHETIGRQVGLDDAELDALLSHDTLPAAAADESAGLALVVAAVDRGDVPDEAWQRAVDTLGIVAVTELMTLVAYYTGLALLLRVFRVGPPDGVPSPFVEPAVGGS